MSDTNQAGSTTKISAGTVVRTVCLLLALVNQVLTVLGYSPLPIKDNTVNLLISTAATVITALVSWWKNNSVTAAAITADQMLKQLKNNPEGAGES